MKLLTLDFDGVICNSIDECLISSYNAYMVLVAPTAERVYKLENIDQRDVELFKRFRSSVRIAKEFYVLWRWIKSLAPSLIPLDFNSISVLCKEKQDVFESIFFRERQSWIQSNIDTWLAYNRIYPEIKQFLKKLLTRDDVLIVSSKNSFSISLILEHDGIQIRPVQVWGHDCGLDKPAIFQKIAETYAIDLKEVFFLDDNLINITQAKKMGLSVFFALWGYSSECDKARVKDMGIPCVALEDFSRWAMQILPVPKADESCTYTDSVTSRTLV